MLTILIYAVCIALTAIAITCILAEPGKPFWFVKKWLEDNYAYKNTEQPIVEPVVHGKIDRNNFADFTRIVLPSVEKRASFWIYEMLGACTVCFSGQLAFWFCGIHKASDAKQVGILLAILATYLIATLTLKNKAVSAAIFAANIVALWLLFDWKIVAQLPIVIGTTIFIAAYLEGIYTRQIASR